MFVKSIPAVLSRFCEQSNLEEANTMQATFPVTHPAIEVIDDMVRQPPQSQEQSWKSVINQWTQIIVILSGMAASVVVIEHRLTTIEVTGKQQAQSSERAAALSSLAVESVIQWIQIQSTTPPKLMKQKGDQFIKEITEKQKKISKVESGSYAGDSVSPPD